MINLEAAGLTPTEANAYRTLLTRKSWKPSELAKNVGESRTNMYKILDKLVGLDLAKKSDSAKVSHYSANNPARLVELAQLERQRRQQLETELEIGTQDLLSEYIKVQEQPGVRFFQGKDGIHELYMDQAKSGDPIYFMLSPKSIDYYGYQYMHELRILPVRAGIPRYSLTPDTGQATVNYMETDPQNLLTRTWLDTKDYDAPMEWGVYGSKTYIVTFGEDAMGIVIDSPSIAKGFAQVYNLISTLKKQMPDYHKLPRVASKQGLTKFNS